MDLYGVRYNTIDVFGTAESNCVPLYYELEKISTTAAIPADFALIGPDIFVHPEIRQNVGNYMMIINTCIDVGTGDDYMKRCEPSMPFQVTINDPCYDTQIQEYAFPASFVFDVPILQLRSFSVPDVILSNAFAQFPWPNSINIDVDN